MKAGIGLIFTVLIIGCATTKEEPKAPEPVTKTKFNFRAANLVEHAYPLPNQSTLMVDWTMSDGSIQSGAEFRAWDVDHDSRFDMLEILSKDGKTSSWAMDFDGDGKVDMVRAASNGGTMSAGNLHPDINVNEFEASELLQLSH